MDLDDMTRRYQAAEAQTEQALAGWQAEIERIGRLPRPEQPPIPSRPDPTFALVDVGDGVTGTVRTYSGETPPSWLVQLEPGATTTDPRNPDAGPVTSRWYLAAELNAPGDR